MARLAAAATTASATGCSLPDSTAAAARRAWSLGRRPAVVTSTRVISPVVTVPVLSSTTASMRRVSSSTSAPLIRMPRRAPRPVPTSSAVGVARPSAQGQAMTSTAMATSSARDGSPVATHHPAKVSAASTSTTGTNTADTRSARRCTGRLGGLGALDEPGDAGERGVGADPGGLDDQPPGGVDAPAGELVARGDVDGERLPGDERRVDRAAAVDDPAVGGDLLAGPHHEPVADDEVVDGDAHLGGGPGRGVDALDGDVLGPQAEQATQGVAGAVGRPGLHPAPEEQERRDDGGGLEPDVRGGDVTGIRARHAGRATGEHDDGRPQVGGQHADRDQGVHRRGAVPGVHRGGAVEGPRGPEHDGRRQHELDPGAVGQVDAGHHREHDDRHGEHGRDHGPPLEVVLGGDLVVEVAVVLVVLVVLRCRRDLDDLGAVARGAHRAEQLLDGDGLGEADGGLLGGEVHHGIHAVELSELLLDPGGARGAGHAGDGEVDLVHLVGGGAVGGLGHLSSSPGGRWRRWPRRPWRRRPRRTRGRRRRRSARCAPGGGRC